jgi:hypothetical protein|eukprot:COSAG01_NODE_49209_length_374_cov_0.749091_1_plen_26_part_01
MHTYLREVASVEKLGPLLVFRVCRR